MSEDERTMKSEWKGTGKKFKNNKAKGTIDHRNDTLDQEYWRSTRGNPQSTRANAWSIMK